MKKYILGIFALLLVVGFSAFKIATKETTPKRISYKWFQISGNRTPTQSVAPANATYLGEGETPPSGAGCGGSTYQCVSGFDAGQVTGSDQLDGAQVPQTVAARKN